MEGRTAQAHLLGVTRAARDPCPRKASFRGLLVALDLMTVLRLLANNLFYCAKDDDDDSRPEPDPITINRRGLLAFANAFEVGASV
jgi:hypothetical protein